MDVLASTFRVDFSGPYKGWRKIAATRIDSQLVAELGEKLAAAPWADLVDIEWAESNQYIQRVADGGCVMPSSVEAFHFVSIEPLGLPLTMHHSCCHPLLLATRQKLPP